MPLLALLSQKCGQRSGTSAIASSISAKGAIDQNGSVAPSDTACVSVMGAVYAVNVRRPQASRTQNGAPSTQPGAPLMTTDKRSLLVAAVHRDDAGAAEAEVVLQRDLRVRDLALLPDEAAELLVQLEALRETGRAERMALREQAARRVHHPLAAVGVLVLVDQPPASPSSQRPSPS